MKKQFLNAILLGLIFTLIFQSLFNKKPDEQKLPTENEEIVLELNEESFVIGRESKPIQVTVKNNLSDGSSVNLLECEEPLFFARKTAVDKQLPPCLTTTNPEKIIVKNQEEIKYDLLPYSYQLFETADTYILTLYWQKEGSSEINSSEINIEIEEPNFLTNIWRVTVYKPIYNFLVLLAYYIPGQSVGLAIILLTFIVRTILLPPTMKGMRSQQAMQAMQPKIQHVQEKYKGNQQKIAEETMKLWKEHKVNPLSSCLPLLLQAPILIGVFYAIQSGFSFNHEYLIYSPLKHIDILTLDINFLNILDLTKSNKFVLPFIVGFLQYIQIKMTMPKKEEKKKDSSSEMEQSMKMMQASMLYMLPIMVAFFSASFPSGISLYWASSTLYGIAQQFYINSKKKK